MTDGVIYDRGYRPYDGPRRGRRGARRAVVKDGVRRILGLRRKARRKVLPWSLIAVALVAAAVFVGLHFAAGSIAAALAQGLPRYGELFDFYSRIALLFIAVTGPELLAPDRTRGVLSVYFSRPLTVDDYLASKAAAYLLVAGAIYVVPQAVLHLGLAFLSDDGFFAYLGANLDVLWKVPVVAVAYLAIHGAVVGVLAAHMRRPGMAAAAFLGVVVAGGGIAAELATSNLPGARWLALLAVDDHPRILRDWIFGIDTQTFAAERVGFEPWVSVVAVAAVAGIGAVWVRWRYRRLA